MPFDVATETPAIRRARLIEVLRQPMPDDWEWDFTTTGVVCGTFGCALGLARKMWPEMEAFHGKREREAAFLGIAKWTEMEAVFGLSLSWTIYPGRLDTVTPAMVADALEKLE